LDWHRFVVKRKPAWLNHVHRLAIRYERPADMQQDFTTPGQFSICRN
jgi:hypothetical protein